MFQLVVLCLGSLFAVLFFVAFLLGKQYTPLIEELSDKEYPLKDFYVVGFFWQNTPLFPLRGKYAKNQMTYARLLYGYTYGEYYARLAWAQTLSMLHLLLAAGFLIATLAKADQVPLLTLAVVLLAAGVGNYFSDKSKELVTKRKNACMDQFPDIVTKMALLVNSGMVVRDAWYATAQSGKGPAYDLMNTAVGLMENGYSVADAINEFGILSDTPEIKKITSSLVQAVEKGNEDIANMLISQSAEQWNHKRQIMLQRGEAAASRLLLPIALMFVGVLIIVVVPIFAGVMASI